MKLTSEGEIVQLLKSAFNEPAMIINRTTRRLTPVKILFIREDSLTPIDNIPLNMKKKHKLDLTFFSIKDLMNILYL